MLQLGQLTVAVAAALLLLLGPAFLGTWFILRRKRLARRERRSPLTRNMLRQAGHSLRVQFEDRQFNIVSDIVMLMMVPSYALASLFLVAYFAGRHPPDLDTHCSVGGCRSVHRLSGAQTVAALQTNRLAAPGPGRRDGRRAGT